MTQGSSFLGAGVGEPSRRALLALDRRLGEVQEALATDITDHVADADPHPQYMTQSESDARYLSLSGGTLTGELVITGSSPQMKFNDTDHDDFWIHVNANNFYILPDRDDSGAWDTPYALQLEADTNTAYTFGNRILTVADEGTGNGLDADTLDGSHASAFAASSHTHSYAATSHTHSYLPLSGGTLTGNLSLRSANNAHDSIYRVGGIFFTWDSDSYGTNDNHSIRSTNGDTWGDHITINSYGNVRINIDSNGNGTNTFTVGRHTTDTANTLFTLDESGNLTVTGTLYAGTGTSSIDVLAIRNEIQLANGSSTDPSLTFSSDGDTGIYWAGSGRLALTANGVVAEFRTDGLHLASGDWFRSYGTTGWYNGTYGGGMYMTDTSWVRLYNGKGFYSDGGRIVGYVTTTSNDWEQNPIQARGSNDIGVSIRSYNSDTHTLQLRSADGICYVRSHNDGSYKTLAAIISSQSSRSLKQDIVDWGAPKSVGAAADAKFGSMGMDVLRRLRPVSFKYKKQDALPRDLDSERRSRALDRLNQIRLSKGLDAFDSDEVIHRCGRDCNASVEEPCDLYRNWERGTLGFIAEEVGEVIPEATDIDLRHRSATRGTNTAIDGLALTAVVVKALQELDSRVSQLEGAA